MTGDGLQTAKQGGWLVELRARDLRFSLDDARNMTAGTDTGC